MAVMTIRNLEPGLKEQLRVRAAMRGHSMEDEVRDIIRAALSADSRSHVHLVDAIHERFRGIGGVDFPEIQREPMPGPLEFEE